MSNVTLPPNPRSPRSQRWGALLTFSLTFVLIGLTFKIWSANHESQRMIQSSLNRILEEDEQMARIQSLRIQQAEQQAKQAQLAINARTFSELKKTSITTP